ncbi:MAG: SH3 domain-containing protein [Bradyrhizobium sp.]|nr:SH3 domain-containing protein [Bradyrhizobium sp.]
MKTSIGILAATGFAMCLPADLARAEPARTVANVNLRASPGASYSIINVVPRGKLVNARFCISNGWCRVEWRGSKGWINGRYLRTKNLKRRS